MARSNVDVRLTTIEADLANLKQQVQAISETKKDWLDAIWGTFANDPLYDEAMELGRKYRESLRPKERSVKNESEADDEFARIGTMDLKIAAIAIANNATLLSRNLKDFGKIPTLQVEDWAA